MTLMEGFQFTRIGADHVGRELPDQACYGSSPHGLSPADEPVIGGHLDYGAGDRKRTRLNSSHVARSYAVVCLGRKKNTRSKGSFLGWLLIEVCDSPEQP